MDSYIRVMPQRFISQKELNDVIFKVVPCLYENDTAIIKEHSSLNFMYCVLTLCAFFLSCSKSIDNLCEKYKENL